MLALAGFLLVCLLALTAPLISTQVLSSDPARQNLEERFAPPSARHLLGTDEFGRDEFTRLLYGAQVSIGLGFGVAGISLAVGVLIGLWAGYFGSRVDDFVNAIIQVQRGVPLLYVLIVIAMIWPPTPVMLAILFGLWSWTGTARQVRGLTLTVKQRDYVDAARILGAHDGRIIFRHVLPNVTSIILVVAGFDIAGTILGEAGLSFLGFGIQPPLASWGNMLTNSLEYIRRAWWLVAAPGAVISFTVLCVLLVADGLRDAFDPRLK